MVKIIVAIMGIIGIIIVFFMFTPMMDSLKDLRTDAQTDSFNNVATGVGVTNATVTLTQDLWEDDTAEVSSITSNNTNDTPAAQLYVSNVLSINGLEANATRNFTILYNIAALEEYEGMSALTGLAPLLLFVSFIAIILGLIWKAFASRRGY